MSDDKKQIIDKPIGTERQPVPIMPPGYDTITHPSTASMLIKSYTHSYFVVDEVVSAYQKAIRRGHQQEAIQWALELFWTGPMFVTTVWNRTLVISLEDVGPAEPAAFLAAYTWYKQAKAHPDKALHLLVRAASYLAESQKTRVNDWSCHIIPGFDSSDKDRSKKGVAKHKSEMADLAIERHGGMAAVRDTLVGALKAKTLNVTIYWATALFKTNLKIPWSSKYKVSVYAICTAFQEVIAATDKYLTEVLQLTLMDSWRGEGRSFLAIMQVINLWCYNKWPNYDEEMKKVQMAETIPVDEKYIAQLKTHEATIMVGMPDYALDKHTGAGRARGRGLQHFIDVGSVINNVAEFWVKPDTIVRNLVIANMPKAELAKTSTVTVAETPKTDSAK